jgi:DNA-binding MarR family transcriptional regulator
VADAELEQDVREAHGALTQLTRFYQFRDRECICCHDISVAQGHALAVLVRDEPLTLGQLSAALYLDKSTASRIVDALQRKGYVRRHRHPADGRALQLAPTERGRELSEAIERDLMEQERRLLAQFAPEVRSAAVELVRGLAQAAACCVTADDRGCCLTGRAGTTLEGGT